MVNEAIRIGLEKRPRTRFQLISQVYGYFKQRYALHTHYILNACESAFAILRNYKRRGRRPYAKHRFLKLDNQTYQLPYMLLKIPVKPRQFINIPLIGGEYQLSFLRDATLKRGSITITDSTILITFSRTAEEIKPRGAIAYDLNERNVTGVATTSNTPIIFDTSKVAYVKQEYSMIKQNVKRSDVRIRRKIFKKYGERQRNRVKQALHIISKKIIQHAKENRLAIVMEKLIHIRKSMRKGNGQGANLRRRLNSWSFRELESQIEYKARWEGIPVEYVRASGTSQTCSNCGFINHALTYEREWICPNCGIHLNRDLNASVNLLRRHGSALEGWVGEAMVASPKQGAQSMPIRCHTR